MDGDREAAEALIGARDDEYDTDSLAEVDVEQGSDKPPAGFNPDEYDDEDDDQEQAKEEGIEADGDDDQEQPGGDDDATPEADEGDEDGDQESDDVGTDEDEGEPDDGGPIKLEGDDLDQLVHFEGLEKPFTLRELAEFTKYADTREQYLTKHRELSARKAEIEQELEAAKQYRHQKKEVAEQYDLPHLYLDHYLREQIENGTISQEMYDDISAVFIDYAEAGSYNAQQLITKHQERQRAQQLQAQQAQAMAQEWEQRTRSEVEAIEQENGAKLTDDVKRKIASFIEQYASDNGGALIGVRIAYNHLVAQGDIQRQAAAAPRKRKPKVLAEKLRSGHAVPGKPRGGKSSARSAERKAAERAFRSLREA